ncbi:MAG: stage III sporulation protein AE [Clostridia bacterium]|nr:stage III sporulation protein AE [Clostridia bacterium]
MKKKKAFIIFLLAVVVFSAFFNVKTVKADDFDSVLENELNNLDLSELTEFLDVTEADFSVALLVEKMIKGEYEINYGSFIKYFIKTALGKINLFLPDFFLILAILLLGSLFKNTKGYVLSEELSKIISFIFVGSILAIVLKDVSECIVSTKNLLDNLSKLFEIMSPIIVTLIVAGGGTTSVTLLKPTLIMASGGFTMVITSVVFPLVLLFFAFSVFGALSDEVDFSGFSSTVSGVIKLTVGLSVTVFGLFSAVTGIAGRSFDGITVKVAKYLLSSSVPLVGGMVKDGLDVFLLGCSLIKNAVGIVGVFGIFYMTISPLLFNLAFSFLLRIASSFAALLYDKNVNKMLTGVADCIKYLNVALLASSFVSVSCLMIMTLSVGNAI